MICKSCGTDNPEEARFCYACGKRLDGKKQCPACGKLLNEEARFCMYCGAPVDPAAQSAPVQPAAQPAPAESAAQSAPVKKTSVFTVLAICGGACVMASVLFTAIFMFCVGFNVSNGRASESAGMMYDFFYDVYDSIKLIVGAFEKDTEPLSVSLYCAAGICTAFAVLGIVSVLSFGTLAAVFFALEMKDGKKRPYLKLAAAAYASFLVSACAMLVYSQPINSLTMFDLTVALNEATVAGIALGAVFLAAGCGLLLASKGRELGRFPVIFRSAAALLCAVLITVVFAFAGQGQLAWKFTADNTTYSVTGTPITLSSLMGVLYIQDISLDAPVGELAVAACAAAAHLVLLGLVGAQLVRNLGIVGGEKTRSGLILSSAAVATATLNLILVVVFSSMFEQYMFGSAEASSSYGYGTAIVELVLCALLFGATLAAQIVCKQKDAPQAEPTV